tara:strand:- start:3195 stop:3401 length:207 start_codon:yes stop_codon:yes gene_type:complete
MNKDLLVTFKTEDDLKHYLRVNGISGNAFDKWVEEWKNPSEKVVDTKETKNTMISTASDETVESKDDN